MLGEAALVDLVELVRAELSERLSIAEIGLDQDFFDLGLDSIDAVELTLAIEKRFRIDVDPGLLFDTRTLNELKVTLSAKPA
ncbi:MAG TPA: acyl carrier protein [Allosphingosinicella sp.]|jgi:acyl carrier protein